MNQLTLETNNILDIQLLISLANRLNVKVVKVDIVPVITDQPIENEEIKGLLQSSTAFDFLKAVEEDIYTDADLKVVY
jgi:hypothetical protein